MPSSMANMTEEEQLEFVTAMTTVLVAINNHFEGRISGFVGIVGASGELLSFHVEIHTDDKCEYGEEGNAPSTGCVQ